MDGARWSAGEVNGVRAMESMLQQANGAISERGIAIYSYREQTRMYSTVLIIDTSREATTEKNEEEKGPR